MGLPEFAMAVVMGYAASASAQSTPIVNFNPAAAMFEEAHGNGMVGWVFEVHSTIRINQVGWYDDGLDGLSRPFQVGLWRDSSGSNFSASSNPTPLLGANGITIAGGTSAPLNGIYRVVNLPGPIDLVPGQYQLAGLDTAATTDAIKFQAIYPWAPDYPDPRRSIGQFFWAHGFDPNTSFHATRNDYFYLAWGLEVGPMVFEVPEPSAGAVLAVACLYAATRRPTRKRRVRICGGRPEER
jgi:hypothetical protein